MRKTLSYEYVKKQSTVNWKLRKWSRNYHFREWKKLAKFSIATNESYKNATGEKVTDTQWHNIIAWNKTAEIIEKYVTKGNEIAIEGKLTSRSYETKEGEKKYITEVVCNELLMLGGK